ncbi:MAG: glycosyltransferase family 9 protein, partial [Chloroflexota bacterium]|nr:glycosyltransferase family 9 protein [Chloroflexota bacterium]
VLTFNKFAFDRPAEAPMQVPYALGLARRLRAGHWDTLVLLHHLTTAFGVAKYAALSLASGAAARIGLDNGRGRRFLTASARDDGFGARHEADYWLQVVSVLGARHPGKPRLELCVTADDEGWAAARWAELQLGRETVLLGPGSGAFSTARRWPAERFAELGRALFARHNLQPLVLSGVSADEQHLAGQVAAAIGERARVAPAAPRPQALAALIRRGRLLIANDSGPVHLATAVGTPVVAIFGPSNDRAWGPYPVDEARHRVAREVLACVPCIHRGHSFGTPQGCPARTCLAILDPASVLGTAEQVLEVVAAAAVGGGR